MKNEQSLFREEVYNSRANQWLGTVRLGRPLSFTAYTLSTIIILILVVLFMALANYNRQARASGVLSPLGGAAVIRANETGSVAKIMVKEGQHVHRGDVLLLLDTDRRAIIGVELESGLSREAQRIVERESMLNEEKQARLNQVHQRYAFINQRLRVIDDQTHHVDKNIELIKRRLEIATENLKRFGSLKTQGFVSDVQVKEKEAETLDMAGQLEGQQRERLQHESDRAQLLNDLNNGHEEEKAISNQLQRTASELKQSEEELISRKSLAIVAPDDAIVSGINVRSGDSVHLSQSLLTLIPAAKNNRLVAQIYVPSQMIGFVNVGQRVSIHYTAFPYQKYGTQMGHITAVSTTPFAITELPPEMAAGLTALVGSNEWLYRIDVELMSQSINVAEKPVLLRPGMTLDADITLDTRRVWELLFQPILEAREHLNS